MTSRAVADTSPRESVTHDRLWKHAAKDATLRLSPGPSPTALARVLAIAAVQAESPTRPDHVATEDRMNARKPKTPLTLELVTAPSERAQATRRENPNPERQIVDVTLRTDDRLLLPVDEAARRLSIGRSLLYELLAAGEIHSIHVGRLRRVPLSALTRLRQPPVPWVRHGGRLGDLSLTQANLGCVSTPIDDRSQALVGPKSGGASRRARSRPPRPRMNTDLHARAKAASPGKSTRVGSAIRAAPAGHRRQAARRRPPQSVWVRPRPRHP